MGIKSIALAATTLVLSTSANASIVWDWSFASEAGQFITDGDLNAGVANAGTYNFIDFSVTSSSTGGEIGSFSNGDYQTEYSTDIPLSFDWNGSHVTAWNHSGDNLFDWWAFSSTTVGLESVYFFGWDTGNVNDPARAAHYNVLLGILAVGDVVVTEAIPVPAAVWLFGSGLLCLFGVARSKVRT